jgi:glycosyltransferase involved in cell wall biosynthesis
LHVLFDQQIMSQRYGGVSRYVLSLMRALNAGSEVKASLAALAHFNAYIGPGDVLHPLSFRMEWPQRATRFRARWTEPLFRLACVSSRPDVVHETGYMRQAEGRSKRAAVVTTLHDMVLERFPHLFEQADYQIRERRQALKRAHAIICISWNTRADLLEIYPEFERKVHVVWHGVDTTTRCATSPVDHERPYLLFVGTRGGYKNFGRLVLAMATSRTLSEGFDLVCFGGEPIQPEETAAIARAGLRHNQVLHLKGSDADLASAYRHARAFVFPSLYEGFGMPLTEAMTQGCPIVCSRASAFPEVAADSAKYFDPQDVDSIRLALEAVALDDELNRDLGRRALARSAQFSWQRCAAETATVYQQARNSHLTR